MQILNNVLDLIDERPNFATTHNP